METGLGGADWNLQDGGTFFECEVVLIAEQEDGSAGGRYVVEEGQEGLVGWLAEAGVEGSEVFRWQVVEGMPEAGMFEMREGDTRSDPEGPCAEDGGLAQERELAEDLERSLLEDVVGEVGPGEKADITAQRRISVMEKLLQRAPVAGLREKDQQGLVERRGLLRLSLGGHA